MQKEDYRRAGRASVSVFIIKSETEVQYSDTAETQRDTEGQERSQQPLQTARSVPGHLALLPDALSPFKGTFRLVLGAVMRYGELVGHVAGRLWFEIAGLF